MTDPNERLVTELEIARRELTAAREAIKSRRVKAVKRLELAQAALTLIDGSWTPLRDRAHELEVRLNDATRKTLSPWLISDERRWPSGQRYLSTGEIENHWHSKCWLRVVTGEDHLTRPTATWTLDASVPGSERREFFRFGDPRNSDDSAADFYRVIQLADQELERLGWILQHPEPGDIECHEARDPVIRLSTCSVLGPRGKNRVRPG